MTVRMRHTKGHRNNRRAHHKLDKPAVSLDESKVPHLRHRASATTGTYKGVKIASIVKKQEKKIQKITAKKSSQ
ncbi:MAG: 50S ribosomal protein L32 [Candidatus Paceibacterota bacterium]